MNPKAKKEMSKEQAKALRRHLDDRLLKQVKYIRPQEEIEMIIPESLWKTVMELADNHLTYLENATTK